MSLTALTAKWSHCGPTSRISRVRSVFPCFSWLLPSWQLQSSHFCVTSSNLSTYNAILWHSPGFYVLGRNMADVVLCFSHCILWGAHRPICSINGDINFDYLIKMVFSRFFPYECLFPLCNNYFKWRHIQGYMNTPFLIPRAPPSFSIYWYFFKN